MLSIYIQMNYGRINTSYRSWNCKLWLNTALTLRKKQPRSMAKDSNLSTVSYHILRWIYYYLFLIVNIINFTSFPVYQIIKITLFWMWNWYNNLFFFLWTFSLSYSIIILLPLLQESYLWRWRYGCTDS